MCVSVCVCGCVWVCVGVCVCVMVCVSVIYNKGDSSFSSVSFSKRKFFNFIDICTPHLKMRNQEYKGVVVGTKNRFKLFGYQHLFSASSEVKALVQ